MGSAYHRGMDKKTFVVTVRVKSEDGSKPIVRALGGDTIFVYLTEGQTARWTVKAAKRFNPTKGR